MKGHNGKGICRKCGKIHQGPPLVKRELRLCACGCGKSFECKITSKRKVINLHSCLAGKNNPQYGKRWKHKPETIKKNQDKFRKEVVCKKCFKSFETCQPNPNNLPKYCPTCIKSGGVCIVCGCNIGLFSKFCKKHKHDANKKRMIANNPMYNKKVSIKVHKKLKALGLNVFSELWKNKRAKMLKAVRSFQGDAGYKEKCSKNAIKRIQEGSCFNRRGINGWHYSKKNKREQYFMSIYELQAFLILDKDSSIVRYDIQPISIPYFFKRQKHRYLIDLLAYKKDGSKCYIEVGAKDRLDSQKKTKIKYGQRFAKRQGCGFEVWLENELGMTKERYDALCKAQKQKKSK